MSKLKLLILDANVVIHLHETALWQLVIARCEVYLSRIVADDEVRFARGKDDIEYIDLSDDINQGRARVFDVAVSDVKAFQAQFDPVYLGDLDPGEAESLTHLVAAKEEYLISSGDAIVFRILGNLQREDQGISLEELLQRIGTSRAGLPWPYTKAFRQKYTDQGKIDSIQGRGRRH
jgi:hypothetical protein